MLQKHKKHLAREVLLFFGSVILTGLIGVILLIRNYYYDSKIKSNQKKIIQLSSVIDSLPPDKIKALYDGIKSDFVSSYLVNNGTYIIPKKEEKDFLKDYPTATRLPQSVKGYFRYKSKDPLKILSGDSTLVFDYMELSAFRMFIKDIDYRNNLFTTLEKNYDLGTKASFESKIAIGLKFDEKLQQQLLNEKQLLQEKLKSTKNDLKDNNEIGSILLWSFIILLIIIYPLRFSVTSIKWALKTIKKSD